MTDHTKPATDLPEDSDKVTAAASPEAAASEIAAEMAADAPREIPKDIPPAAQRALAEAEERRRNAKPLDLPVELGGRDGPEPIRFGDYERRGIAVDF